MSFFLFLLLSFLPFTLTSTSLQLSLLKALSSTSTTPNLMFSPLHIYQTLSLLSNGANGQTQLELLQALNNVNDVSYLNRKHIYYLDNHPKTSPIHVNAIYTKIQPMENFLSVAKKYKIYVSQYTTAQDVNTWFTNQTNNKINEVITSTDTNPVDILIINAGMLKIKWKQAFSRYGTFTKEFNNADGTVSKVKMMKLAKNVKYYETKLVKAIELPFAENKVSAVFFLPKNMTEFINALTDEMLTLILRRLNKVKVNVEIPKFIIEGNITLIDALKAIGVTKAFSKDKADFGGITNHMKLYVNNIIHKTMIQIDEEGSISAMSKGVQALTSFGNSMFMEDIKDFLVDKPFLVMILDSENSENMIYIAKVDKL